MFENLYDKNYVPNGKWEEVICRQDKIYNSEIAEELIKLGHRGFKIDVGAYIFNDYQTDQFEEDYDTVFRCWWDFDIKRNRAYYIENPGKPFYSKGSK